MRLLADLPVAAVERVYSLPLAEVGPLGVPADCAELYKGQRIKDRANALPTVPTARQAEQFILDMLEAWQRDRSVPVAEVLEAIEDVRSRLSYESIDAAVERQVKVWMEENQPTQ